MNFNFFKKTRTRYLISTFLTFFVLPCMGETHELNIKEVVVTAQKRDENMQKVPIALSVFSGESLAQLSVRNLSDIGRFTSGVETNTHITLQPSYNIRGIETNDFTVGSDPAIALYVDDIYTARGGGSEIALVDVSRIEILKGPQGTLFGRNATGGAIRIFTQPPTFETEGKIKVSLGDKGRKDLELVANQPLSGKVAARLVAVSRNRGGLLDNLSGPDLNNENQDAFRLSLLWQANEQTSALLRFNYSRLDQRSGAFSTQNPVVFEAANPDQTFDAFGPVAHDFNNSEKRNSFGASLEISHNMGSMEFISLTGWQEFKTELLEDVDGSNNADYFFVTSNPEEVDYFSQEFRLSGDYQHSKWTIGANYSKEHAAHRAEVFINASTLETFAVFSGLSSRYGDELNSGALTKTDIAGFVPAIRGANQLGYNPFNVPGCSGINCDGVAISAFVDQLLSASGNASPGIASILGAFGPKIQHKEPWAEFVDSNGNYESWAVYADTTWHITQRLNITGGLRYSYDNKIFNLYTQYQNTVAGLPFGLVFFNNGQTTVDTSQSKHWGLFSGRLLLDYAFSKNSIVYGGLSTGFKSGGFNSLNFGPSVDTSYDNEEVISFEVGTKGQYFGNRLQLNTSIFFYDYKNLQELDLVGKPPAALVPSYTLRNSDADIQGFEVDSIFRLTDRLTVSGNFSYLDTKYTDYHLLFKSGETALDDLTGQTLVDVPKTKINLGFVYAIPITDSINMSLRMDYSRFGKRTGTIVDPNKRVDSYEVTNARANVSLLNNKVLLSLWSTNMFNKKIISDFGATGESIGSLAGFRISPRMVGIDMTYIF